MMQSGGVVDPMEKTELCRLEGCDLEIRFRGVKEASSGVLHLLFVREQCWPSGSPSEKKLTVRI